MKAIRTIFFFVFFLLIQNLGNCLFGQDFQMDFTVSDGEFETEFTVILSPNGSDSFINGLDIYAPPPAPSGAFDAYMRYKGESYLKKALLNDATEKQIVFNYSKKTGNNPIRIAWEHSELPSSTWRLFFIDNYGGTFLTKSALSNFNGSIVPESINNVLAKELILIIEYDATYTSVNDPSRLDIPNQIQLFQNYPNPFNPSTQISFNLTKTEFVRLEIYNSVGQKIESLLEQNLSSGINSINWNAQNHQSGLYFYQLRTANQIITKKMILLK